MGAVLGSGAWVKGWNMMNFVFISPHFPKVYWNFCDRLKRNGVNVLGVADVPYDELSGELKAALTEYYRVDDLEDYDQVFRALAFFTFQYGKIDWVESNNEYWMEQDARLRTDFNICTGPKLDEVTAYKSKSAMKAFYKQAGVPCARYHMARSCPDALEFVRQVGYPIIVKPDVGVGASATYRLSSDEELSRFFEHLPEQPYIMEEFIRGEIYSYDGISDSRCTPLFEASHCCPQPIMDVVNRQDSLTYYSSPQVPQALREVGRRTLKAFGAKNRFFHLEFFKLLEDKEGLGKAGDFVALEVNMRPAGGYTPDMIDFANSVDVYQIFADMAAFDECRQKLDGEKFYCVYSSRRDARSYRHSHEEILSRYGGRIVMQERMPAVLATAMGDQMYTAKLPTYDQMQEFIAFVQE